MIFLYCFVIFINLNYLMEIKFNKKFILISILLIIFIHNYIYKNKLIYSIDNINKYIIKCHQWRLIDGIRVPTSEIPKITALIPSFNSSKTIKYAIRSIQNQNMSDLEIIVVDDNSKDNTTNILKELQKEDKRIKIILNKRNMGTLFTRSIGALNAKGKYIMSLDNDDLFIDENIFNICFEESEKNNIDLLEFIALKSSNETLEKNKVPEICSYSKHKRNNLIVKQPELSSFIYQKKNNKIIRLIDATIWGKCIKTDIYKLALNTIGERIYSQYIITNEDRIINFVLFKVANSFKFINKYGIIHYKHTSIVKKLWKNYTFYNEIFNIEFIYNFTKNTTDVNICAFELFNYKSNIVLGKMYKKIKKSLNIIINNLLKEEKLTQKNKNKLIKYKREFN